MQSLFGSRRRAKMLLGGAPTVAFAITAQNFSLGPSWSDPNGSRHEMIQAIRVVGKDDRVGFSAIRSRMNISEEDANIYNRAVGKCICPAVKNGKRKNGHERYATCSLLKFNDRVATSAHLFIDESTNNFYPFIDECYFEALSKPYFRRSLAFDKGFSVGAFKYKEESNKDFAFVMLEKPLAGVKPIFIDETFHRVVRGEEVYVWTAPQDGMTKTVTGEPVAQICKVVGHFRTIRGDTSNFGTDCDLSGGGSGGIVATHLDGRVVAIGMNNVAPAGLDGQISTREHPVGGLSLYFSEQFLEALSNPKAELLPVSTTPRNGVP